MRKLPGEVGNWVAGDRFWGREKECQRLLELLCDGANISIIAQRRIGKTSLMREVGTKLPDGYIALHIDVQDANSPTDMVVKLVAATRLHASLWKKTKETFSNILSSVRDTIESVSIHELEIQLRAGLSGGVWQQKGAQVLDDLAARDAPVVLFIDELPILIANILEDAAGGKQTAHLLLSWLRAQALRHRGRLRMVFAGSIGLEPVLSRAGLTADVNHLTPFLLDPWTDAEAAGCLQALATHRSFVLPDEATDRMLALLGCNIPHHVQLFFAQVREHCLYMDKNACTVDDVEHVFTNRMLGTRGHAELTHLERRLEEVFSKDELPLALDLLTQAAVAGSIGRSQMLTLCERHGFAKQEAPTRLRRIFEIFEHDGYLQQNASGEYQFISNLLRQWWHRRFGAFFEQA